MEKQNHSQWILGLTFVENLGRRTIMRLIQTFVDLQQVWKISGEELADRAEIPIEQAEKIQKLNWKKVKEEYENAKNQGIQILGYQQENYPERLLDINDPPPVLYVKGEILPEDQKAIAVVGTRNPTPYGIKVSYRIGQQLAERNITVISGLARGIDVAAHRGALSAKGRTIAILGNGLNSIYPSEHKRIADEICKQGAIISEYPMTMPPLPHNFPQRNRIISGLSKGVLVIQGGMKSGSLITADTALEQGREIFALPGEIGLAQSTGPHWLIQQGAKLFTHVQDIVDEIPSFTIYDESKLNLSPEQKLIWKALSSDPTSVDEISHETSLDSSVISSHLVMMEVRGFVKNSFTGGYVRNF